MAGSRAESPFLIAFVDLTRFGSQSQRVSDGEIADTLDQYYRHVTAAVEQARAGSSSSSVTPRSSSFPRTPSTAASRRCSR